MAHQRDNGEGSPTAVISANELLAAAPDSILVVDKQGQIIVCNRQVTAVFGYTKAELVGQSIEILIPQRFRHRHVSLRKGYVDDAQVRPMGAGLQLTAVSKEGREIPVEVSLSPVSVKGERGAIAIVRDVTEMKRRDRELESHVEALKRSNEELEQFAYVASHDLQEPLRMVSGYTQLLKRRYDGRLDAEADEFIGFAVEGVKRMQELIADLLSYSRVSTRSHDPIDLNLDDVIDQVESNLEVAIRESSAKIVREGELPVLEADRTQLTQLFQNLIGNAVKFRGDRVPDIRVGVIDKYTHWELYVADNGIGISPEYQDKIFVIFQRLHTRDDYEGTGIGLAICKKIVERHGGQISVVSVPGEGSRFVFTLPKIDGN